MKRGLGLVVLPFFILGLLACATPRLKTNVVYADDGQSEISVPAGWASRADLGQAATLRVGDTVHDAYLMVFTYLPDEIAPTALAEFAERLSAALRDGMQNAEMSGPRQRTIDGRPAVEYEVAGYIGDTGIVYQSTVLEGRRARYHHLVSWTTAERYDVNRDTMRAIAGTFRESATPRPAKPRIDLTFDWPEQFDARAVYYSKKDKSGRTLEMRAQGVTRVRPLGRDRLLVSTRLTRYRTTPPVEDTGEAGYIRNLLQAAMTDVPDYVVTTGGEFVRVENLGAYHRRLEQALLKGLPGGVEEAQAKAQQLVKRLLSEQVLAAAIEDEWNAAVGAWAGGSYVPGETYRFVAQYRAPALGQDAFPMAVTQQLTGSVRCHARAQARSCVRLVQTTRVATPDFTAATSRVVNRTVGGNVAVEEVEVLKQLTVVADRKTMLPYEVRATETKRVVVTAGGEARTGNEVQESITSYSYGK